MTFVNSTKTSSDSTLFGTTSRRFLWCWLLLSLIAVFAMLVFVVFTFSGYFSMPTTLHPGFSGPWRPPLALSCTMATFDCFTFPSHFHSKRYSFEWALFTHRRFFPYSLSPQFCNNLLLSRPPWESAVLPWISQGFMLILETQIQPICLFDSQQSTIFIFRRIRI